MSEAEIEVYKISHYYLEEGNYTLSQLKELVTKIEEHEVKTRALLERAMQRTKNKEEEDQCD
jgi:hypothetical protein